MTDPAQEPEALQHRAEECNLLTEFVTAHQSSLCLPVSRSEGFAPVSRDNDRPGTKRFRGLDLLTAQRIGINICQRAFAGFKAADRIAPPFAVSIA